jgi:excisionase family DNA binding protein
MSDQILTTAEIAAELRCSKAHVYKAINGKVSGVTRLPAIHMGRRKLVRRSSLELWKRENEIGILGKSSEIDAVGA